MSPWSLRAWPPIYWFSGQAPSLALHHLGTRVTDVDADQRPTAGQTIWGGSGAEGDAGMAWDWVRMPLGMVAMADPMCVVSNLCIVNDEGEVLTAAKAALVLNEIVYSLPWQKEVRRAILATH
jgi:hypothetical protein